MLPSCHRTAPSVHCANTWDGGSQYGKAGPTSARDSGWHWAWLQVGPYASAVGRPSMPADRGLLLLLPLCSMESAWASRFEQVARRGWIGPNCSRSSVPLGGSRGRQCGRFPCSPFGGRGGTRAGWPSWWCASAWMRFGCSRRHVCKWCRCPMAFKRRLRRSNAWENWRKHTAHLPSTPFPGFKWAAKALAGKGLHRHTSVRWRHPCTRACPPLRPT